MRVQPSRPPCTRDGSTRTRANGAAALLCLARLYRARVPAGWACAEPAFPAPGLSHPLCFQAPSDARTSRIKPPTCPFSISPRLMTDSFWKSRPRRRAPLCPPGAVGGLLWEMSQRVSSLAARDSWSSPASAVLPGPLTVDGPGAAFGPLGRRWRQHMTRPADPCLLPGPWAWGRLRSGSAPWPVGQPPSLSGTQRPLLRWQFCRAEVSLRNRQERLAETWGRGGASVTGQHPLAACPRACPLPGGPLTSGGAS